jgi:2-keto-3-deoxy-L-rhamnonate aldolase RhmA
MRPNRLKRALQAGSMQFGTFVTSSDPQIVEAIGYAGCDFVILDMEHTAIDYGHLPALCAAAENAGMTPLVRVGACEPNPILRVLDSGAFGVIAPHVRRKEDAAALVAACRYPPLGIRGVNGGTRAAGYGQANFVEHARQSNEEILTIALIEDVEAVEAIEAIVRVPGLDIVFPGAGDLSASLGLLGQAQHPTVQEQVHRVVHAVQAHPTVHLAYHIMDPQQIIRCRDMGVQLIVFSQDSRMVMQAYRGTLAQMRAAG